MFTPIFLQRMEGLALLIAAISLFSWSDQNWWWFALLLLAPDLSMAGYAVDTSLGATIYNLGHTLVWPIILLGGGWAADRRLIVALGAVWLAHIGMDRALGYGLKLKEGFKHTHLGIIGGAGRANP
jgi:hypothetical protein